MLFSLLFSPHEISDLPPPPSTGEPQADWGEAERQLVKEYSVPVSGRSYRQGTSKTFFNYLLIDPRVADVRCVFVICSVLKTALLVLEQVFRPYS